MDSRMLKSRFSVTVSRWTFDFVVKDLEPSGRKRHVWSKITLRTHFCNFGNLISKKIYGFWYQMMNHLLQTILESAESPSVKHKRKICQMKSGIYPFIHFFAVKHKKSFIQEFNFWSISWQVILGTVPCYNSLKYVPESHESNLR